MNRIHCARTSDQELKNGCVINFDKPEQALAASDYLYVHLPDKSGVLIPIGEERADGFGVEGRTSPLLSAIGSGQYRLTYSEDWRFVMESGGGHGFNQVYRPPGNPR